MWPLAGHRQEAESRLFQFHICSTHTALRASYCSLWPCHLIWRILCDLYVLTCIWYHFDQTFSINDLIWYRSQILSQNHFQKNVCVLFGFVLSWIHSPNVNYIPFHVPSNTNCGGSDCSHNTRRRHLLYNSNHEWSTKIKISLRPKYFLVHNWWVVHATSILVGWIASQNKLAHKTN